MSQNTQPQPPLYNPVYRPSTNPYDFNENRRPFWLIIILLLFDYSNLILFNNYIFII